MLKKKSKTARVLAHLEAGRDLTQSIAVNRFKIGGHIGQVVYRLKEQGHDIVALSLPRKPTKVSYHLIG